MSSPDQNFSGGSFNPDPFPPFTDDCELDYGVLEGILEEDIFIQDFPDPVHEEIVPPPLLSSSFPPPSNLLQNQENPLGDFSGLDANSEECQFPLYSDYGNRYNDQYFNGSRSFDQGTPSNFFSQPRFDDQVMESQSVQPPQTLISPEENTSDQMRMVCSNEDLQMQNRDGLQLLSSQLAAATATDSLVEEVNSKWGPPRYTPEERKERIHRYREKRRLRNFNKIRYASRKTVADNKPRIRGRFVRKDEPSDMIPKPATSNDLSMDNLNDQKVDEGTVRGGNVFGPTHLPSFYSC